MNFFGLFPPAEVPLSVVALLLTEQVSSPAPCSWLDLMSATSALRCLMSACISFMRSLRSRVVWRILKGQVIIVWVKLLFFQ